jgi:hypothetical protein
MTVLVDSKILIEVTRARNQDRNALHRLKSLLSFRGLHEDKILYSGTPKVISFSAN